MGRRSRHRRRRAARAAAQAEVSSSSSGGSIDSTPAAWSAINPLPERPPPPEEEIVDAIRRDDLPFVQRLYGAHPCLSTCLRIVTGSHR